MIELTFFLIAGLHIVIRIQDEARMEGMAAVLIALPLKNLSDVGV